jgi:hypothetical protein
MRLRDWEVRGNGLLRPVPGVNCSPFTRSANINLTTVEANSIAIATDRVPHSSLQARRDM